MNEDKILQTITTEGELRDFKHQALTSQDRIITILDRLDQERLFTSNWVSRIESEIARIKTHLKIG